MLRRTTSRAVGVSGMAVFAPPCRVDLKQWCDWSGNDWKKVSNVVGSSFRIPAANENAYTMAANAALRLILNNDVDPQSVGFLGLGTESSTDNSAGAVIVRGMLDKALRELGKPPLSRHCEVPEFKHACLGGIYALKSAARYAAFDGKGRTAIVVASDIAEYARGSTGEQTQGSGAVAMLVENTPKMFTLDLQKSGSGSAYRGPDFRKPVKRHFIPGYREDPDAKIADFPVFSGPYSTVCYLEETMTAVEDMLQKLDQRPSDFYNAVSGLFFHRPYNMMPIQAMSFLFARGLARSTSGPNKERLEALCAKAKVSIDAVRADAAADKQWPDLFGIIESTGQAPKDPFGPTNAVAKALRSSPEFTELLNTKMALGSKTMAQFGNLYTASLPAWVAAGFEEAQQGNTPISGHPMVIIGYGSGDAAESIPIRPVDGWEQPAAKIGCLKALSEPVDLTREQYETMHAGKQETDLAAGRRSGEFVISHTGMRNEAAFQDIGVDYYNFVKPQ